MSVVFLRTKLFCESVSPVIFDLFSTGKEYIIVLIYFSFTTVILLRNDFNSDLLANLIHYICCNQLQENATNFILWLKQLFNLDSHDDLLPL